MAKSLIFVAAALIVASAVVWNAASAGPRYAGKSTAYWFGQYCEGLRSRDSVGEDRLAEATVALRRLDTNAIPFLWKAALGDLREPGWRIWYRNQFKYLPEWLGFGAPARWQDLQLAALSAIGQMRPLPAAALLPQLENLLAGTDADRRLMAITLLSRIGDGGEAATPLLLRQLSQPNDGRRVLALLSLMKLGPKASAATPELLKILERSHRGDSEFSASAAALGAIGTNAAMALPTLERLFAAETNFMEKARFAGYIVRIRPQRADALDYLIAALDRAPSELDAIVVAGAFGAAGLAASRAIPALASFVTNDRYTNSDITPLYALRRMGASNTVFVPKLIERMRFSPETGQIRLAKLILRVNPRNSEAQQRMLHLARTNSLEAMDALADSGPAAKNLLPELRAMLPHLTPDARRRAASAIHRIEFMAWVEDDDRRKHFIEYGDARGFEE